MQIRDIATSMPAARDIQSTASQAPSAESRRIMNDVAAARTTAMSALNNDRFRVMLEQIGNPQSSGDLVTMGGSSDSTVVDFKTALSRYAENSE